MRTILIIQKEFRQIFRNKAMLPIIFILPFVQLLILSNAASFEVKNIKLYRPRSFDGIKRINQ
jgi:ABC-2 type transport system permease protein